MSNLSIKTLSERREIARAVIEPMLVGSRDRKIHSEYARLAPGPDGNVHTFLSPDTASFRLSSSESLLFPFSTNLQNLTKKVGKLDPLYRTRDVIVPRKGMVLLSVDFSGAEAIGVAAYSRDWDYLDKLLAGLDTHTELAIDFWGTCDPLKRDVAKTIKYACLPLDTEILTLKGWKHWDAIKVGDACIGFDGERLVNDRITNILHYENAETVLFGHARFRIQCTPNHRWLGRERHGRKNDRYRAAVFTAENFKAASEIRLAAPFAGGNSHLTPNEAALIGWLATDGSIIWSQKPDGPARASGRKHGVSALIHQKKLHGIKEIRALLRRLHVAFTEGESGGCRWFRVPPAYIRTLWRRAGLSTTWNGLSQMVLTLKPKALNAFNNAVWLAEGWGSKRYAFVQNIGPCMDAFRLGVLLEGYAPRQSTPRLSVSGNSYATVYYGNPWSTCQTARVEPAGRTSVWCPTTNTGAWVARQGRHIFITGNSSYVAKVPTVTANLNKEAERLGRYFTQDEVFGYLQILYRRHPLQRWWQEIREALAENDGALRNCFGYRRTFHDPNPDNRLKDAASFLPQSTVAWLMNRGIAMIFDKVDLPGRRELLHQIHDELLFQCYEDEIPFILKTATPILEIPFKVHERELYIPVEWSCGPSWGLLKKLDKHAIVSG